MGLKIMQHVFSSFIHLIYICPTWINTTWEKCYFQNGGVFFFSFPCTENARAGRLARNGGKRSTQNRLVNTLTWWNMTIGQWLRVKLNKDFLSSTAQHISERKEETGRRRGLSPTLLAWNDQALPAWMRACQGEGLRMCITSDGVVITILQEQNKQL